MHLSLVDKECLVTLAEEPRHGESLKVSESGWRSLSISSLGCGPTGSGEKVNNCENCSASGGGGRCHGTLLLEKVKNEVKSFC